MRAKVATHLRRRVLSIRHSCKWLQQKGEEATANVQSFTFSSCRPRAPVACSQQWRERPLGIRDAQPGAGGPVFDLVPTDLADVEVGRLGV